MMVVFTTLSMFSQGQNCCPPASTATPVVDGKLDASYQFFKNIKLSVPLNNLYSRATIYKFEDATTLYLAFVESRAVNDNVYGPLLADVSYAGWGNPKLHVFKDLLGSDKVQIQLFDASGVKKFDVLFDYLFQQNKSGVLFNYNSGLIKFLTPGCTTPKYEGSPSSALGYNNVTAAETSEDYNQTCVALTTFNTNSPGPPESSYPCWEYRYIYEVAITKSGLGLASPFADTSKLQVPLVHNSPNKSAPGVSGYKYCDANGNGAWDAGEVGLGGWTINLAGPTNATAVTDANGFYEFYNIATGSYTLSEVNQSGYTQTQGPAGFTLAANQLAKDKNFGNRPTCCAPPQSTPAASGPPSINPSNKDIMDVQIAPNPFTDVTQITIISPVTTKATVEIYDLQGRKIKTLFDGTVAADIGNSFHFSIEGYNSGQVFVCVVRSPQGTVMKKILKIQ